MIFGIKEKMYHFDPYNAIFFGYCYKYTCAT